ncbi:HpcH/HpaI aldolase/citrate lyase family protein [Azoarcus taiwanensis]|uniref:CoA ester lyase n=1 Tax=Azoarcus taiwanensis TaxID=666964 RepID=A0A972F8B0_9RHOO|nr:CoA ester lyase [Azoarcus taiwanensis]NMG03881.1 CoA ester lyase [Azoarcus taiwanensis]
MSGVVAEAGAVARSWLFVPGNRPERFEKALASGADAVILDLEDAVAPADKDAAREAVAAWLSPDRPVYLRINAADTEWFADDLELVGNPGVAGVVLPKAEAADILARVAVRLPPAAVLLPLVETGFGVARAETLAAQPRVLRLMFGTIDFQLDLGIDGEDEELAFFRSKLVLASRLAGVQPPIDGVTTAIRDLDRLQADTQRARRMGFGGKLCIHPDQIATVNRAFAPSDEELAWAYRVVEAAGAADGAAVAVDGKMVDRPVLLRAQRMIAEAARRGAA